jgi:hypothetical protein
MITDLEIVDPGDGPGPTLCVTTGYSGFVSAWDLTPAGPVQTNASRHTRNDVPGTTACIGFIQTSQGLAVLTGGGANGPLVLRDMKGDGGLGAQTTLGTQPSLAGDMIAMIAATLTNGTQMVHGGFAVASGIGQLCSAQLLCHWQPDRQRCHSYTAATSAGRVVALADVSIGGQQYLFTASSQDVGITCLAVSLNGSLTARTTLESGNGLWIGTPTFLDVAVVAGQTYLVQAAAGSPR